MIFSPGTKNSFNERSKPILSESVKIETLYSLSFSFESIDSFANHAVCCPRSWSGYESGIRKIGCALADFPLPFFLSAAR